MRCSRRARPRTRRPPHRRRCTLPFFTSTSRSRTLRSPTATSSRRRLRRQQSPSSSRQTSARRRRRRSRGRALPPPPRRLPSSRRPRRAPPPAAGGWRVRKETTAGESRCVRRERYQCVRVCVHLGEDGGHVAGMRSLSRVRRRVDAQIFIRPAISRIESETRKTRSACTTVSPHRDASVLDRTSYIASQISMQISHSRPSLALQRVALASRAVADPASAAAAAAGRRARRPPRGLAAARRASRSSLARASAPLSLAARRARRGGSRARRRALRARGGSLLCGALVGGARLTDRSSASPPSPRVAPATAAPAADRRRRRARGRRRRGAAGAAAEPRPPPPACRGRVAKERRARA